MVTVKEAVRLRAGLTAPCLTLRFGRAAQPVSVEAQPAVRISSHPVARMPPSAVPSDSAPSVSFSD